MTQVGEGVGVWNATLESFISWLFGLDVDFAPRSQDWGRASYATAGPRESRDPTKNGRKMQNYGIKTMLLDLLVFLFFFSFFFLSTMVRRLVVQ